MKLLIFQASDIHLSSEKYPINPVLDRVPLVNAAIKALFLHPEEIGGVLLLVTGDLAYAGLEQEYKMGLRFLRDLEAGLKDCFPKAAHHTFLIPGNHDCNLTKDDQARQKLIDDPDSKLLEDGSIITAATAVQNNFFDFCKTLSNSPVGVTGLDRLVYVHQVTVGNKQILVRTLNSAWASRIPESRTLMLPLNILSKRFAVQAAPAIVITTLHHPYNWFEPTNGKGVRKLLEETSDIILTGHEHSASTYIKTGLTGEQNEYIEGGVLQENGDPTSSSFNVVLIDLESETQEVRHYAWNGELYECVNEVAPQPFVRNKFRLKREFEVLPDFEDVLNDPDAAFAHPHKDRIQLDDVFIYPDCIELDAKHSKTTTRVVHGRDLISHILKKTHVIITAAERAGKTALSRSLFKDLRKNGKIPLMLSGRDVKPSALKRIPKLLDDAFATQYVPALRSRYWQLPKASRAVLLDDYHKLPMTKDLRNALVKELIQRFDVVILLGGSELRLQELAGHDRETRLLWDFDHCEVMGFGHRLRAEFIKKWYRIGREGNMEDQALVEKAIALERTISNVLGHDLLPPYPIYLLLLLQQLESTTPLDTTAASYGRLYGAVVTAYLAKSQGSDDLETKINYLTELAFHIYKGRKTYLVDDEVSAWHEEYCKRHLETIDLASFREELVRSQVLQYRDGHLRFRTRRAITILLPYICRTICRRMLIAAR
jgi:UDP-2,3-diacylglucosamine pyrophosphatase LpxH